MISLYVCMCVFRAAALVHAVSEVCIVHECEERENILDGVSATRVSDTEV